MRCPFPDCPPTGRDVGVRNPRAVGAGVWVWGPNTVPLACMPCGGCVPRIWWGAVPGGGWPATVVRGVWCQALSLPRPPVLWSGQPGFRDPCVPVRSVRAWGPSTAPTACALAGPGCSLWGWRKGVPGGGAFHHCERRLRSGAVPPPTARPLVRKYLVSHDVGGLLGSATHVLWVRVCGGGGPTLSPWPACPVGAACRGGGRGPSPRGVACHCCEGRLVSGAVPPPAALRLEQAARVPQPVCPGCGRCGRGDPVYCTVLYCSVLYCAMQWCVCCTLLYCIVLERVCLCVCSMRKESSCDAQRPHVRCHEFAHSAHCIPLCCFPTTSKNRLWSSQQRHGILGHLQGIDTNALQIHFEPTQTNSTPSRTRSNPLGIHSDSRRICSNPSGINTNLP